jgi:hypothetical protein
MCIIYVLPGILMHNFVQTLVGKGSAEVCARSHIRLEYVSRGFKSFD